MLAYSLVLFIVIFWSWVEKKTLNRKAFWIPLITLALFAGIRSSNVGSDSGNYVKNFNDNILLDYFEFREEVEYGYQILEYSILNFSNNYFWLFFITALLVVSSYLYVFKKLSVDYLASIYIYITFNFYTFFFNGLRQGIAMAIVALSIPYLIQKKFLFFLIFIILSSFFHKSALIMVLFYFLINLKIKIEYKLLTTFIGSLFLSRIGIEYLGTINERYSSYSEVSENSGGYLTLALYTLIGVFIYFFIKKNKSCDLNIKVLSQMYLLGVIFLIPIAMIGSNPSGPQRLLYYFVWTIALIFPYILRKINEKLIYICFFVFCLIYFYLFTSNYANLSPYTMNETFRIF